MVIIMFPKKYEQNISRALDSVTNLLFVTLQESSPSPES